MKCLCNACTVFYFYFSFGVICGVIWCMMSITDSGCHSCVQIINGGISPPSLHCRLLTSSGWRNASKSHDIYLLCERRWGIILILIHHRVLVDHSLSARAQPWIWSCTAFIWVLGQKQNKKNATQLHSMTIHSLFIFIFFAKINCIRLIDYYRVSWMRRGWESAALQAVCRSIYWISVVSYSLSTTGALAFLLKPVMWFTIMHVLPHLSLTGLGCCGSGARNTEHEAGTTLRSMTGRETCTPHTHLHLVHTHLHLIQLIIDSLFFLIFFGEVGGNRTTQRKPIQTCI